MYTSKIKYYNIIIVLLLSINTKAQILSGKVVNYKDNPIIGAIIILNNNIVNRKVLSDVNGKFSFNNISKNKYRISVESIGYIKKDSSIDIHSDTIVTLYLSNDTTSLSEVVVNSKSHLIHKNSNGYEFNIQNSFLNKGNNGLDILSKLPNISLNNQGEILLRKEIPAVYVNGRKLNLDNQQLLDYLKGINSENVKSIIIENMASSSTEATFKGGTINIILKDKEKGYNILIKNSGSIKVNRFGGFMNGLDLGYGNDFIHFYASSNFLQNNEYGNANSVFNYYNTNFQNITSNIFKTINYSNTSKVGFEYFPNKHNEVTFEYYLNKPFTNTPLNISELEIYNPYKSIVSNNNSFNEITTTLQNETIGIKHYFDSSFTINVISDFGKNYISRYNNTKTIYLQGVLNNNNYVYISGSSSKYFNLQTDFSKIINNNSKILFGFKISGIYRNNSLVVNKNIDNIWINDSIQTQSNFNHEILFSGFASYHKTINNNKIIIGARLEDVEVLGINNIENLSIKNNYSDIFPSFQYSYDFGKNQLISILYRKSINRPSFREITPFKIKVNDFFYLLGNPDLKPEYRNSWSIDYSMNNKSSFSINGFWGQNLIQGVYSSLSDTLLYKTLNFGRESQYEFDYTFSGKVFRIFNTNMNTGLIYQTFKNEKLTLNKISFNQSISLSANLFNKYLFEVSSNYNSKYSYRNIFGYPQYYTNFSISHSFFKDQIFIKFEIFDLFNSLYYKNISYYNNYEFDFYQKTLSRTFKFLIQYSINKKQFTKKTNLISKKEYILDRL